MYVLNATIIDHRHTINYIDVAHQPASANCVLRDVPSPKRSHSMDRLGPTTRE
jgi:hypothetical protein